MYQCLIDGVVALITDCLDTALDTLHSHTCKWGRVYRTDDPDRTIAFVPTH